MFSGIVEEIGTVAHITTYGDAIRMRINATTVVTDAHLGDSIAVSGVCLTITDFDETSFTTDLMQETLNRSALGEATIGSPVNLERALRVNVRLGGHIVQGHVDGTTELLSRTSSEHWDVVRFRLPDNLARYVVEKGSIAISGTSLTISAVGDDYFEVSLIPATLEKTTLGTLQTGHKVNLEVDILAKYVEKLLNT
ncbi:MAG: riboflavin synthase [Corynebacterium sp.]|nr:riboflavin synthase [Corynebacterium sp.]